MNSSATALFDRRFMYKFEGISIYKLNASTNSYVIYYENATLDVLNTNVQIVSVGNRIILYSIPSASSIFFYAFWDSPTGLKYVYDFRFSTYTSQPRISYSSNLTKIVIYSSITDTTGTNKKVDAFSLQYNTSTVTKIDPPMTKISNISETFIGIEERWMYVRQLGQSTAANIKYEYAYSLQLDTIPSLAKSNPIDETDSRNWVETRVVQQTNNNLKVFTKVGQSEVKDIEVTL